ncbi:MAG: DnaJ domain-containing protein [Chlamydiae bacterium]|nr:DnaJ domain-containing protein [Chlamydiota bacterium]
MRRGAALYYTIDLCPMTTYYELLEIDRTASREAVKAAFRAMAKKYHPDFHPDRNRWAHDRIQEVLRAYEVLFDDEKRAVYDRTLSRIEVRRGSAYRESLRRRGNDPAACCQLVFLDLLEGRGREGLALYERMRDSRSAFSLKAHMPYRDFLDCGFLVAEELERQHRPRAAFEQYREIYREDASRRYFRHFRAEIRLRMRNLVLELLETEGQFAYALGGFADELAGEMNRRERAFLYKKIAERYCRAGEERLARITLLAALQLHPRMGGVKKIRARLRAHRRHLPTRQG